MTTVKEESFAELGPFLTVKDVAQRLKVSQKSVRRWIAADELNAYRIGKQLRISEADLIRFLKLRRAP